MDDLDYTEEVKAITQEANKRIYMKYPLQGEHTIKEWMTEYILQIKSERMQEGH